MTRTEYGLELEFTKDTSYLALTGELWGVSHDDFPENRPRYNGTALYSRYSDRYQDCSPYLYCHYRVTSSISRTESQNLTVSRAVLQLLLPNPLESGVESSMKM